MIMKKHFPYCFSFALFLSFFLLLCSCGDKDASKSLTEVRVNEVAHSIFYAPFYVSIEEGYFADEGIDLSVVTGFGADKTMTAVLSGEADIGFMGPETTVYAYQEGANDPVINFAQLTRRAGNFVIARENMDSFSYSDLKGHTVIGGRAGGMPEMVFEYVLRQNGMDPARDLTIVQNVDFGSTAAAFSGGTGDYTIEFEPAATALESEGKGYVVASLGVDSGYVPYTAFSAKESFLKEHGDTVSAFTRALRRGMDFVDSHTPSEIAEVIAPQFPDTEVSTIAVIVERYGKQDTWNDSLVFSKDGYELLLSILRESGELKAEPPYDLLVNTEFVGEE